MRELLTADFWYGWPGVVVIGYAVIGFLATPEMALLTRVWAGLAGGVLLVGIYYVLWAVGSWLIPSRRSKPIDD